MYWCVFHGNLKCHKNVIFEILKPILKFRRQLGTMRKSKEKIVLILQNKNTIILIIKKKKEVSV